MTLPKHETIIACGVFRHGLEYLKFGKRFPHVRMRFVPSNLHINPCILERRVEREMRAAERRGERIACLYGDCFPGIDECCLKHGAKRAKGCLCYEMLLGPEAFRDLIEETAGTYFLERELITDFEKYCAEPLELHDPEIRRELFKHYKKLVYVRQPVDLGLESQVTELARFLDLALDIRDTDYSHLERQLGELIDSEPESPSR